MLKIPGQGEIAGPIRARGEEGLDAPDAGDELEAGDLDDAIEDLSPRRVVIAHFDKTWHNSTSARTLGKLAILSRNRAEFRA